MDLWRRRREERQAVDEAGGGVSEGFELADTERAAHASHGDSLSTSAILRDARPEEPETTRAVYGEADAAHLYDSY